MDSTNNFQHHHEHDHHQHLQDHFLGCSPLIPHISPSSSSLHWNPHNLLSTTTSNDTFYNKLYENNHETSYQQSTSNFPKEEEDMLSSFPTSFTALINNNNNPTNIIENNNNNNNNNGLFSINNHNSNNDNNMHNSSRGLMYFPLDHHSTYNNSDNNNNNSPINNWISSTSNHGFPTSSSNILHQLGLVSSPNNSKTSISSSSPRLGLNNMHAMDLLGTNNSNASFGTHHHLLHEEAFSHVIDGKNTPRNNKGIGMTNGLTGTKRAAAGNCANDQSKASTSNTTLPNKKSQLKPSCPPLKVRKEKLGDRIASLHQLVSPFGKTDTASVLTEAIGYIQFLQDQIHTLCMPNANNKPSRQMGRGTKDGGEDEGTQTDIRRRGLCLVPVSWTSYIAPNQFDASNTPFY